MACGGRTNSVAEARGPWTARRRWPSILISDHFNWIFWPPRGLCGGARGRALSATDWLSHRRRVTRGGRSLFRSGTSGDAGGFRGTMKGNDRKLAINSKLLCLIVAVAVALLVTPLPNRPFAHASEYGSSHFHAAAPTAAEPCDVSDQHCCQPAHCLVFFPVICQVEPSPPHGVRPSSASLPLVSIAASRIDPPPKAA